MRIIARLKRAEVGTETNQVLNAENHVVGICVLPDFAIEFADHMDLIAIQLVLGHQTGPKGQ